MGKFSDSPFFLLQDFFAGRGDIYDLLGSRPINNYVWPTMWTDREFVTFDDYNGVIWNLSYYYDPNIARTDGSYLVGLETNIITNGDGLIDLWVKETEEPYKQFLPITLRWDRLEDNNFIFNDNDLCNLSAGPSASAITGLRYQFIIFDSTCQGYSNYINNNREVYFRKDSVYQEWLTTIAPTYYPTLRGHDTDIRNYVNSDKIFSYFGDIYGYTNNPDQFRIVFDGLKDFAMRAIPEHQRTANFNTFMNIFFDKKWHEVYNQIKNIWTLIDPMEVDEDFLGYLSVYYHMQDLITPTLFRQREFVRDLIWLLKRKGSYIEFYIIWRTVANTANALNIYEYWHDKAVIDRADTHVLDSEWQEYIYVEKPEYRFNNDHGGAGIGWYNRYFDSLGQSVVEDTIPPSAYYNYPVKLDSNPTSGDSDYGSVPNSDINLPIYGLEDDRILSTHYKVEIDVSTEPLLTTAIIDQDMWDEMYQYWDYLRPVNRVVDYNILIAPITDFSGKFISLYDYSPSTYDLTKVLIANEVNDGWLEMFTVANSGSSGCSSASSSGCHWIIDHTLDSSYLHTMALDLDWNQIIPDEIEIVNDDQVIFWFDQPTDGWAVLKRAQYYNFGGSYLGLPWRMYHYRKKKEVVLEVHNNSLKISSESVHLTDRDYTTMLTSDLVDSTIPASSGAYVFVQDTPAATWEVYHPLWHLGVIMAVYDTSDNQIVEYNMKIDYVNRCTLSFDVPTDGYAVLIPVANRTILDIYQGMYNILKYNASWRASETLGNLAAGTFAASGSIVANEVYQTDDWIYCNAEVGKNVEGSFVEFGLFDGAGNMIVYSKSSEIYKAAETTMVFHFRIEKTLGTV